MSEDEISFDTSGGKNDPPILDNEDHGVTLWLNRDKNGETFLN